MHDRSPLCTLALAQYLGHAVTPLLAQEVARIGREQVYERAVFLICPLGFLEPAAARRISYPDSLESGALHEAVYQEHGFKIVHVAAGQVIDRAGTIAAFMTSRS
jgi:predicted ATPase